jgi:hypothetical protein
MCNEVGSDTVVAASLSDIFCGPTISASMRSQWYYAFYCLMDIANMID